MSTAATQALRDCFEDVYLQRYLLEPRLSDLQLIAGGWKLRYAVDTNVFALYVDPMRHASPGDSRIIGVGEVFRSDQSERKIKIAAALAYFIWNELEAKSPLLLLPPLNQEVERIVQHFVRQFEDYHEDEAPVLAAIRDKLLAKGHVLKQQDLADLRDAVMLDSTPQAAMSRIRTLFSQGRIRSADSSLLSAGLDDAFRRALRPATDLSDMDAFAVKRDDWLKRIGQFRKANSRALRDAEAMARLEICNSRLTEGGETRRLIYITSDASLLEAGEQYEAGTGGGSVQTFSQLFLRHPRAYLNEPQVLSPSTSGDPLEQGSVTIAEWLHVLVGRFDDLNKPPRVSTGRVILSKQVVQAIQEVEEADNNAAASIQSEWSKYETVSSLNPPQQYVDRLLSAADAGAERFLAQLDQLREEIRLRKKDAWEACFSIGTTTRFVLEVVTQSGPPTREPPPLVFEARRNLHSFLDAAQGWLAKQDIFSMESYSTYRQKVRKEDESGYGDYIAHGYLMALQMQWRTAAIFAARAIECVTDTQNVPAGSNGREAYYFEAFCRRHSASSLQDLEGLDKLLFNATRTALAESSAITDKNWPHDPVIERFEGESFALQLSRHFFRWSVSASREQSVILDDIGQMVPKLRKFERRVDERYHQLQRQQETILGQKELKAPEYFIPFEQRLENLLRVRVRTLRNILAIGLQVPTALAEARSAWLALQAIASEGVIRVGPSGLLNSSFFARFLYLCGAVHFSDQPELKKRSLREIQAKFDSRSITKRRVFPYDGARMADILQKLPDGGSVG
jgi:hypothetical protein